MKGAAHVCSVEKVSRPLLQESGDKGTAQAEPETDEPESVTDVDGVKGWKGWVEKIVELA
jgi:hypothetical protein